MNLFLIALEKGIALGSIYVLVALSFTLILAVSGVFNFLQGTVLMIATVLSFILTVRYQWPLIAIIGTIVLFGVLSGIITHTLFVRPVVNRSRNLTETTLLATLGGSIAAGAAVALPFGSESRPVPSYVSNSPWQLGGLAVSKTYVVILLATLVITIVLVQILRRTDIGRITRVTLEDLEGARLLGVNTGRVVLISFAVAGGLAALAGWLVTPVISASPFSSTSIVFYAFAAMAVGGFGSFEGAMLGGGIIGLAVGLIPAYTNPEWVDPAILILVILSLVIRPAGLLGTAGLFGATQQREL